MSASGRVVAGRYRLVAPIGEGGFGSVWLAQDLHLDGRDCAVKIFAALGEAAAEALRIEAGTLTRLDHPVLPRASDAVVEDGSAYLVMDFVPGRDLQAVLVDAWRHGRRLDEATVLDWADDVLSALSYLHRQAPPVVHRDVKPANLKITPDGQVRLVDFGLAGPLSSDGRTLTLRGTGSPPYQPLEQSGGREVDGRADLYALGATLYHLLAGRPPATAAARFVNATELTSLTDHRDDLSPTVAKAIERAMALHPNDRPPTADALRLMLRERSHGSTPSNGASSGELATALRKNLWLAVAVVVLFLAALAISLTPGP